MDDSGTNLTSQNVNESPFSNGKSPRYFAASWYLVFCICGLIFDSLILMSTITLHWKDMKPFYIFLSNLLVSDSFMFLLYLLYPVPSLYSNKDIFGSDYGRFIAGSCQTFFFEVSLSTSFLITIHRCLSIHFPQRINNIFTVRRSRICAGCTWIFGFLNIEFNRETSCVVKFSLEKFIFRLECTAIDGSLTFSSFVLYIGVYAVGILYVLSIRKLRMQYSSVQDVGILYNIKKNQIKIFLQAFFIWVSLLVNTLAFRLIGVYITNGVVMALFTTIFTLCPVYSSGLCVFIFAKKTRNQLLRIVCSKTIPSSEAVEGGT